MVAFTVATLKFVKESSMSEEDEKFDGVVFDLSYFDTKLR